MWWKKFCPEIRFDMAKLWALSADGPPQRIVVLSEMTTLICLGLLSDADHPDYWLNNGETPTALDEEEFTRVISAASADIMNTVDSEVVPVHVARGWVTSAANGVYHLRPHWTGSNYRLVTYINHEGDDWLGSPYEISVETEGYNFGYIGGYRVRDRSINIIGDFSALTDYCHPDLGRVDFVSDTDFTAVLTVGEAC